MNYPTEMNSCSAQQRLHANMFEESANEGSRQLKKMWMASLHSVNHFHTRRAILHRSSRSCMRSVPRRQSRQQVADILASSLAGPCRPLSQQIGWRERGIK